MSQLDVEVDLPQPGETCSCGRPAAWTYITVAHGRVPYCGVAQD